MRFTKAFQLIALALVLSIMQVYVMAGPIKAITDPRTTDTSSSAKATNSEAVAADTFSKEAAVTTVASDSQLLTAKAAAERMPLTASSKTTLGRIFSKGNMEARAASGNISLKANASFAESFKASSPRAIPAQTSSDDSDSGGGSRGTWIAVGVIAAVLTIAIIGLRHDRSHPDAATGL